MRVTLLSLFFFLQANVALAGPSLIGGEPTTDYPEAVYISMGGSRCTATIVGPKAVLTAAHCISTGGKATFTLNGKTYTGVGERAPLYPRPDQDIAMVLVSEEIATDRIATVSGTIAEDDIVKLSGYGCVRPGGGGGNDGIFRHGNAKVTSVPSAESTTYDFVTQAPEAALCYGDSGGPVWKYSGTSRTVVGVNSKGNIRTVSYLSYLQKPKTLEFLKGWAEKNSTTICGINKDCGAPIPPKPECRHEEFVVEQMRKELLYAENVLRMCAAKP